MDILQYAKLKKMLGGSGGGANAGASIDFDLLQNGGARTNYIGAFAYWSTDGNFRPIYPIKATTDATRMFEQSKITDLEKLLEGCGVTLTLPTQSTKAEFCFLNSEVTHLPKIAVAKYTRVITNAKKLKSIREIPVDEACAVYEGEAGGYSISGTSFPSNAFTGCAALEEIHLFSITPSTREEDEETTIISKGGAIIYINLSACTLLSHDTLIRVGDAMADAADFNEVSGGGNEPQCILGEANLAKLTDEEKEIFIRKGVTLL